MKRRNKKNSQAPFRKRDVHIWELIVDNKKKVMPVLLIICVLITVAIALHAGKGTSARNASKDASLDASGEYAVPNAKLELNAYPVVNELMAKYYKAFAGGDIATIESISQGMSQTRELRIQESAKFIDSIPTIDVYTKPGPVDGSYIVYVYEEIKFKDYDTAVPGMESMYVCTKDDGSCYINFADDAAVSEYIREISLQDDVVDLNNKVATKYNEMVAGDADLAAFLTKFTNDLNETVGEALASDASSSGASDGASASSASSASGVSSSTAETSSASSAVSAVAASSSTASAASSAQTASTAKTIEATDVVNIRSSDSETADVLGKTEIGQTFTLIENIGNGWSKIKYQNGEAYVKTQYFKAATSDSASTSAATTAAKTDTKSSSSESTIKSTGTKYVKETVRIRKSANTDAKAVGTAYVGDSIEVLKVQADGWSKVKYNGTTGYVKTEYLKN
ncbi:MAG: SH3 domain-containing protein [Butyrivibrio sp.]|jgi:uncharacterized protein YgiM (DUF1202 family)|nr:SH3 domain-containing protein [Butyrivibrio sp.]